MSISTRDARPERYRPEQTEAGGYNAPIPDLSPRLKPLGVIYSSNSRPQGIRNIGTPVTCVVLFFAARHPDWIRRLFEEGEKEGKSKER